MDIEEIRRGRLRELIRTQFDGNQSALADAIDRMPNYISRVLGGKSKGFGEEFARDIERILKLEPGWLDKDPNATSLTRPLVLLTPAEQELVRFYRSTGPHARKAMDAVVSAFSPEEKFPFEKSKKAKGRRTKAA